MFFGRLIAICIITVSLQIPWFIFIIICVIEHLYGVEGYVFFFMFTFLSGFICNMSVSIMFRVRC